MVAKKECRRRYYNLHKEEEKQYQKGVYWKDPERARLQAKLYRIDNSQKVKKIKEKSRVKCEKKIQEYNKKYYWGKKQELVKKAIQQNKKRKYNLSMQEIDIIKNKQNNKCGICSSILVIPCVDHIHGTKKIRGLLCRTCNSALGYFEDNIVLLKNAILWLSK
jgi:hypothetical protein